MHPRKSKPEPENSKLVPPPPTRGRKKNRRYHCERYWGKQFWLKKPGWYAFAYCNTLNEAHWAFEKELRSWNIRREPRSFRILDTETNTIVRENV